VTCTAAADPPPLHHEPVRAVREPTAPGLDGRAEVEQFVVAQSGEPGDAALVLDDVGGDVGGGDLCRPP
jgi:hypothetical protein